MRLVDTHSHIHDARVRRRPRRRASHARARRGVELIVTLGVDRGEQPRAPSRWPSAHDGRVVAAAGVHPHDAKDATDARSRRARGAGGATRAWRSSARSVSTSTATSRRAIVQLARAASASSRRRRASASPSPCTRARRTTTMLPLLERVVARDGRRACRTAGRSASCTTSAATPQLARAIHRAGLHDLDPHVGDASEGGAARATSRARSPLDASRASRRTARTARRSAIAASATSRRTSSEAARDDRRDLKGIDVGDVAEATTRQRAAAARACRRAAERARSARDEGRLDLRPGAGRPAPRRGHARPHQARRELPGARRRCSATCSAAAASALRPAIALLAGKFGEYNVDLHVPLAASIELLHTATLVHDDVIDASPSRRGRADGERAVQQLRVGDARRLHVRARRGADRAHGQHEGRAALRAHDHGDRRRRAAPGHERVRVRPGHDDVLRPHRRQDGVALRHVGRGRRDGRALLARTSARRCARTA